MAEARIERSLTAGAPSTAVSLSKTPRRKLNGDGKVPFGAAPRAYSSALLFVRSRIGFIRRRLDFGALGFAERSFLVSLSLRARAALARSARSRP